MDNSVKTGTVGGTLITIIANLHLEDLVKTVILALVGALVSFGSSYLLKKLLSKTRQKQHQ